MTKPQQFQTLAEQFETLAHILSACEDKEQRKHLLRKMKVIIDQVDELIFREHSTIDSERESTAPQ
jgi:hypothetical protein